MAIKKISTSSSRKLHLEFLDPTTGSPPFSYWAIEKVSPTQWSLEKMFKQMSRDSLSRNPAKIQEWRTFTVSRYTITQIGRKKHISETNMVPWFRSLPMEKSVLYFEVFGHFLLNHGWNKGIADHFRYPKWKYGSFQAGYGLIFLPASSMKLVLPLVLITIFRSFGPLLLMLKRHPVSPTGEPIINRGLNYQYSCWLPPEPCLPIKVHRVNSSNPTS